MFNPFKYILGLNNRSKKEIEDMVDEEYNQLRQEEISKVQEYINQEKQKRESESGVNDYAHIVFAIDTKGQIGISVNWNKPEPHVAEYLGKLLYHINNGNLKENCFAILENAVKQKPKAGSFIRNILETWRKMVDDNDPVMKPSEVFRLPIAGAVQTEDDD